MVIFWKKTQKMVKKWRFWPKMGGSTCRSCPTLGQKLTFFYQKMAFFKKMQKNGKKRAKKGHF